MVGRRGPLGRRRPAVEAGERSRAVEDPRWIVASWPDRLVEGGGGGRWSQRAGEGSGKKGKGRS